MKSFNAQERDIIKTKLLECCEECWSRYGYKKTNIRELCEMCGISTGAFYMFFPSKEHLFFETAQHVGDRIGAIVYRDMPENPTKYDFSAALKKMYGDLGNVVWYLTLESELSLIVRKLPAGYMESASKKDLADLSEMIEKYRLSPKIDLEIIINALSLLSLSILNKKLLGSRFDDAFALLLDTAIEGMFE